MKRYTIKELKLEPDTRLIFKFLDDRLESVTNVYSPLSLKINTLQKITF